MFKSLRNLAFLLGSLALAGCASSARLPVSAFARDLDHPRWLYVLPNGDVLVAGDPLDVLTGFVKDNGEAMGRPVGVAIDKRGALLVADDVGNVIWRVTAAAGE